MSPDRPTLQDLARKFATDLTRTLRVVVGEDCPPFEADTPEAPGAAAAFVRQGPAEGITLRVEDEPILTLTAVYECTWDGWQEFLAVSKSGITVFPRDELGMEPLFRYEYVKEMRNRSRPAAHFQVHGNHPALTDVLQDAGSGSVSGRRLNKKIAAGKMPTLSKLHFPLGGHRFRPCLEDILEVLMDEFGVTPSGDRTAALEALADGREDWRRTQVAAATRDAPEVAIRVLEDLGYEVRLQEGREKPKPQTERLRAL